MRPLSLRCRATKNNNFLSASLKGLNCIECPSSLVRFIPIGTCYMKMDFLDLQHIQYTFKTHTLCLCPIFPHIAKSGAEFAATTVILDLSTKVLSFLAYFIPKRFSSRQNLFKGIKTRYTR